MSSGSVAPRKGIVWIEVGPSATTDHAEAGRAFGPLRFAEAPLPG